MQGPDSLIPVEHTEDKETYIGDTGKIMIIGSGWREHAIAWKLAQAEKVTDVFIAPGNVGMRGKKIQLLPDANNIASWIEVAEKNDIGLVVVWPEQPLVAGVVDAFRKANIRIIGPTQSAAQVEGSKNFSKEVMNSAGVPTALYETFVVNKETPTEVAYAQACKYVEGKFNNAKYMQASGNKLVVKFDGLAAGKGVTVATNKQEALEALEGIFVKDLYKNASPRVVIEDFLPGEEASYMVLVGADGKTYSVLPNSQDHKRLWNGDMGPNTGGMWAYSPAPIITPEVDEKIQNTILQPFLAKLVEEWTPFTGFLYIGLMIDNGKPSVVECNARLWDPETEVMMMRMDGDTLHQALLDSTKPGKTIAEVQSSAQHAITVVLASPGYPESPQKWHVIDGLTDQDGNMKNFGKDVQVFFAGVAENEAGELVTNGGRVLMVTAVGDTLQEARDRVYDIIWKGNGIYFKDMQVREDIGYRALWGRD